MAWTDESKMIYTTRITKDKKPKIEFIDTPKDIRDTYQYFTEANMDKLKSIGYDIPFHGLEQGISDYVKNYLVPGKYY